MFVWKWMWEELVNREYYFVRRRSVDGGAEKALILSSTFYHVHLAALQCLFLTFSVLISHTHTHTPTFTQNVSSLVITNATQSVKTVV